jgi:hypothetical protein
MKVPDSYDTVFMLTFVDPELADLQVRARYTWGLVDSTAELGGVDLDAVRAGTPRPEDVARLRTLVDDFADALVGWNLTGDAGQALPADRATVRQQDVNFVLALLAAFLDGVNTQAAQALQAAQVDESTLPVQIADGGGTG